MSDSEIRACRRASTSYGASSELQNADGRTSPHNETGPCCRKSPTFTTKQRAARPARNAERIRLAEADAVQGLDRQRRGAAPALQRHLGRGLGARRGRIREAAGRDRRTPQGRQVDDRGIARALSRPEGQGAADALVGSARDAVRDCLRRRIRRHGWRGPVPAWACGCSPPRGRWRPGRTARKSTT